MVSGTELQSIAEACRILLEPEQVTELRILGSSRGVISGYFTDFDKLATAAQRWNGKASIYMMVSRVNPALLARANHHLVEYAKHTTSDSDIERRQWLLLDFDPHRPAGISSTDAEHEQALLRASECVEWLRSLGLRAIITADSGNGAHILVRIDLPNDAASRLLVKRCIEAVALRVSDEAVAVDMTVYNAARIWKVYGTVACKGDSIPERPHRLARILEVSDDLTPTPRELLEQLAALVPEEPTTERQSDHNGSIFNLDEWITERGLDVIGPHPWGSGRKWVFLTCPWNSDHTNRSAYLLQFASGAIAAGCHHSGCAGKGWRNLRNKVEPGWRARCASHGGAGSGQEGERPLQWYTIGQLREETSAEIHYLVDGLLAESSLSVIGGKIAVGKSTLARTLARCVMPGGKLFLGRPTKHGAVLYVAPEESKHGVMKDLEALGFTDADPLHLCFASSPDVLEQALAKMEETQAVLVIFETIFRVLKIRDANDYAEATQKLDPILALARKTAAHVLFTHHLGKTDREYSLDSLLGSTAIGGTPDTRIILKRKGDLRTIEVIQRYGKPLSETVLEFDSETKFIRIGRPKAEHDENLVQDAILECLKAQEEDQEKGQPLDEKQINEEVEGRNAHKRTALRSLVKDGQVEKLGKGGRKDPFRYRLKASRFSCPDVPEYMWGHGDKNPQNGATPQKDSSDSCPQESEPFVDSLENRGQESQK